MMKPPVPEAAPSSVLDRFLGLFSSREVRLALLMRNAIDLRSYMGALRDPTPGSWIHAVITWNDTGPIVVEWRRLVAAVAAGAEEDGNRGLLELARELANREDKLALLLARPDWAKEWGADKELAQMQPSMTELVDRLVATCGRLIRRIRRLRYAATLAGALAILLFTINRLSG